MWNLFHGKPSSQVSDRLEHQDDNSEHRNTAPTTQSATASNSTTRRKKHSSRRKEERNPFPDSTSANHDNPDRSDARAGGILSKASSYVTARGRGDDEQVVGGPGGEMSSGRPSRDGTVYSRHETDPKESGTSERKRRKSSLTGKRTKDSGDRKERRSRDDINGERDRTAREGQRGQGSASKKYDLIRGSNGESSRGPDDFSGQIAGTGFTQFPGQYEGAPQGSFTVPSSYHEAPSSHVQDQFPGQFPAESSAPYRPPLASAEGGPGLAAEYYGDTGQSVADQPGYRKHSPSLIIGAEPHLQPASSVAAPPTEPSQMGATGAAASFYSGAFEDDTSSTVHTTSKPYTTAPNPPNGTLYTSSAPVVPTLAGATAGAAAGYMMSGGLSSSQHVSEHGSSISGSHGHFSQPSNQDQTSASQNSFYTPSNRPPRPSKQPSQSSNVPLVAAGAAGAAGLAAASYAHHHNHSSQSMSTAHQHPPTPMQQRHRHQGPFGALVDFVKDPAGVAQFEEYSEIIGVCRGCFEPGSSPRDAPRKHRFYKRRSKERLGSSTRVDKQYRYSSSDDESRRKNAVNWIGAGLAGYGLGKVGQTLFNRKNDFDDSSDVKSGRLSPRQRLSPPQRSYDQTLRRRHSSREDLKRRDSNDALSYRKRDHGDSYAVSAGSAMSKQRPSASGVELKDQSRKSSQPANIRPEPSVTGASISAEQRKHQNASPSILRRSSRDEELVHIDGSRKKSDKRKGKRKNKGFFSFLSPSSSSSASSLELSSRTDRSSRRGRKSSSDRIKNNHEAEAALLGLGAATAALALHNGRSKKGRKGSAHRDSKRTKRTSSASSDDTWESASELDLSHVDSDLAFGSSSSNASHDSLVSVSPVIRPRRDVLRDEKLQQRDSNSDVTLPAHNATSITSDPTGASMTSRDRYDTHSEPVDGPMPLQMVYPVSTSDPGRFDVQREDSVAASKPSTTISRPSPVPIQQPQPIVPVSSSFYSSQVPGDRLFNGAEEPNRMAKSSDPVSLHKISSEPSASRYEAPRDEARRDDDFQHRSLKRRDTSPARLAEDEVSKSMMPSQAGPRKDDSSTVRFAMTTEQEEQDRLERRRRRREERESGERREARRKSSDDRVVNGRDVSGDLAAKTSDGGSNTSWIAPAAGIAGAAAAITAMSAKSDKEESREERRDRRRREREREDEVEAAAKSERRRRKEWQRRQVGIDEEDADEPNDVSESKIKPAAKNQQGPVEDASPSDSQSVWQEAGTAKQTAHEDYQSFFSHAVTDILNKSGDQVKVTSADPDADVSMDKEVFIVEIAPKKRIRAPDEPEYSPADTDERLDTSRRWPWRVPNLKLVQPTPPVSRASTPFFEPPETIGEEAKEPLEEPPTSKAIPVDDVTPKPVEVGPSAHREVPPVTTTTTDVDRPRRNVRDYSDSESDGQAKPKSKSVGEPDNSDAENPSYGDDYEFAATLAASAQEAGFDPSLVIDNPTYHRRDSPPSSESREADPSSYDFDATTVTSSEKRRREKRSRDQISPMTSISRNDSAIVDDIVSQVEQPSSGGGFENEHEIQPEPSLTRESTSEAPVGDVEDEPLSKRDRKKKSKRRSNGLIETDPVIPTEIPEGTEDTPSLTKSGSVQRNIGDSRGKDGFRGIDSKEPVSAIIDDFGEPRKRKKKSKRNKVNEETGDGPFDGSPEVGRSTQDTLAKGPDTNTGIASREFGSDNVSESFLGMRPDPPPPPDPESEENEAPGFEAMQYSERSQGRPSRVVVSESQQSPGSITSPTRVPVHFKTPPPNTPVPRSSSQSPLSSSRSMSEVVRQTKPRPRSMELKRFPSSKEIRPLWLVERHQSHQEPSAEEKYPPLPESHDTSTASSVHDLGESDSEQERDMQQTSRGHLQDSMQTGEQSAPDMLDSQTTTPTAASFAKKPDQPERSPPIVGDTPETEQRADAIETPKPRKALSRNQVVDEMVTAATNADEHPEEDRQGNESKRQEPLVAPESGFAFRDPFVDEHARDDSGSMPTEENLDIGDLRQPETALLPVISPFDEAVTTGDKSDAVESGHDAESERGEEAANVGKDPSIERFIGSSVDLPEWTQSPVKPNEATSAIQESDGNDNLQFTAEGESRMGKRSRSSTVEEPPTLIVPQQDTTADGREQPQENREPAMVNTSAEIPEDDAIRFTTKQKGKNGKRSRQSITEKPLESVASKEGTVANFSEASDSPQQQDVEPSILPTTAGNHDDNFVQLTKRKKGKKGQKGRQSIIEEPSEPVLPKDDTTLDVAKTFVTPEQQVSETPMPSAPAEKPFVAESPQEEKEETVLDIDKRPGVQEQQAIEPLVQPARSVPFEDDDDTFQFTRKKKAKKGKKGRQSVYEPKADTLAPDTTTDPVAEELDVQSKPLDERRSLDPPGGDYNIPALAISHKKGKKGTKPKGRSLNLEGDEGPGASFSTIETKETQEAADSELLPPEESPSQPVVHGVIEADRLSGVKAEEAAHSDAYPNVEMNMSQNQTPKIIAGSRELTSFAGNISAEPDEDLSPAKIRKSQELMEGKHQDASIEESMRELGNLEDGDKTDGQPEQVTEPAPAVSRLEKSSNIVDLQSASPSPEDVDSHESNAALTQQPEHDAPQLATTSALESNASQSLATIGIEKNSRDAHLLTEDLPKSDRNVELGSEIEDAQIPKGAVPQDVVTMAPTELNQSQSQEEGHRESTEAPSGFSTAEATDAVTNTVDLDESDPNIATEDIDNDSVPLRTKKDKKKKKRSQASEVVPDQHVNEPESSLVPSLVGGNAETVPWQPGLEQAASSGPDPVSQIVSEPSEGFFEPKGRKSKEKSKKLVPFALDDVPEIQAGEDESVPYDGQEPLVQGAARMENISAETSFTESKNLEPSEQLQQSDDAPATSEQQELRPLAPKDPNVTEASPQADDETSSQVYGQTASNVIGIKPPDGHDENHPADQLLPSYPSEHNLTARPSETTLIPEATPSAPLKEPAKSPTEIQASAPVPEVAVSAEGEAIDEYLPLTTKAAKKDKKKSKKRQAISWNDEPTELPSEVAKESESLRSGLDSETTTEAQLPASVPDSIATADIKAVDKDLSVTKKPTKDKKKAKKRHSLSWDDEDLNTESPAEVVADPSEGPESNHPIVEDEPFNAPREPTSVPNTATPNTAVEAVNEASPLTKKATSNKKKAKRRQTLSWDEEPVTEPTAEGAGIVEELLNEPESIHSAIEHENTTEPQESSPGPNTRAPTDDTAIDEASSLTKRAKKDRKKSKKRETLSWDEEPTVAPPAGITEIPEAPQEPISARAMVENEIIKERKDSAPIADDPGLQEVEPIDEALPTIKKAKKDKKKAKKKQFLSWDEESTDPPAEKAEGPESLCRDGEFELLRSRSPESEPRVERDQGDSSIPDKEVALSEPVEALAATEPTKVVEPDAEMPKERSSKGASPLALDPAANDIPPKAIDALVVESTGQDISREQDNEQGPVNESRDANLAPFEDQGPQDETRSSRGQDPSDELVVESTGQVIGREQENEQGPVNESRDANLAPFEDQGPQDERRSSRSQDSAVAEQIFEREKSSTVDDRLPTVSQVPGPSQLPTVELQRDDQTSGAHQAGVTEDAGRPLGTNRSNDSLDEPGEQQPPDKDVFDDDRIPSKERVQAFTDNILGSQAAETGDVRAPSLTAPVTMDEAPAEQPRISGPPTLLSAGSADLLDVEEQREYDEQYARELERQLQGQMPDQILGQETQGPEAHQSEYEASMPLISSHEPRETLAKATSLEDIVEEPLSRSMLQQEKPETQGTQGLPFQPTKRSKKGKKGKKPQQPVIWEDETATAGISPEPEPAVDDLNLDDRPLDLEENIVNEASPTKAISSIAISPSAARRSSKAEGDNGDYFGIQPSHRAEVDVGGTGEGDRRHSLSVEPAQIVEERNEPETEPREILEDSPADQGTVDDGVPLPSKKSKKRKGSRMVSEVDETGGDAVGEEDRGQPLATGPFELTQEPGALAAESRDVPVELPKEQDPGDEWQPLPSKKGKKSKKSKKAFQPNEDDVADTVEGERSQILSAEPASLEQESMLPFDDVPANPPDDPPADDWEPLRTKKSKRGKKSGDASTAKVVEGTPETAQVQPRNNGQDDLDGVVPISQESARPTEAIGDAQTTATEERADDAWEPLPTKKGKKGKKSRKASQAEVEAPKVDEMVEMEQPQQYGDAQEDLDAKGATTQEETALNETLLAVQPEPVDRQEEADDWSPLPAKKGKKGKKSRNASKAEIGLPKVDETLDTERTEQHDGLGESDAQISTPHEAAETLGGFGASASLGAAALAAEGLSRKRSKKDRKEDKKRNEDATPFEDDVTVTRDLETAEQPPSNVDLTQMDERQVDPTSQHHAESAPLPESVQAEPTRQISSIDVDEQRQRDSAIHVQMSPKLPEESVHRVERDSGYPATEPSPILEEQRESREGPTEGDIIESYARQPQSPPMDIEQELAPSETGWPADEEQDSKADFTERHMSDPYHEKSELPLEDNEADLIESYGDALEGDHSDPLIATQYGQAETEGKARSEASERSSTPPTKTPGSKPKRRKSRRASGAAYDSDDSADSGFDVQKRRRRIQALAEEPREPSPVSSTTKDRSSALFDSSPSGRDGHVEQLRDRSPVDAEPSAASAEDAQMQHEHIATIGEPASSFGNIEGARTQEGPSLFGGHARPEDSLSESRSPVQMVERGRQGLRRVSESSIEQTPRSPLSRKDKRDVSDIGTPEQGVKTRRKSRKFPRREGTPSSGGEELRSQPSLQAGEDGASSIGFQESIGRNTDRVPSRLSNMSGPRSLRSPGIGSPDSIHAIIRTPEQVRSASGQSIRSSGTPPLRRVDRSISGDLRAASRKNEAKVDTKPKIAEEAEPEEAGIRHQLSRPQLPQQLHPDQDSDEEVPIASSSGYDPVKDKGKTRADPDMADYEGFGAIRGQSPMSPTRPPSMRKRQSMHFAEMEQRLAMLASENSLLQNAKSKAEKRLDEQARDHSQQRQSYEDAIKDHKAYISDRNNTLNELNHILDGLRQQVAHLTSANEELVHAREEDDRPPRLAWERTTRELADLRVQHSRITTEHEGILTREIDAIREEKDTELHQLREELEDAKSQIRKLQQQILSSRSADDIVEHDEDYFDAQCQELCRHLTSWVTRFSKLSDNKRSFLAGEIRNEAHQALFEDCMLDGSEVDDYLQDRHRRRDVFMAVTMALIFKHIFARYLFGMDREHRQKLKALDKTLQEVGPPAAVHKWRATTLNLLSKRPTFQREREREADAVVEDIWTTLSSALPPPATSTQTAQCRESLRRIINLAVDLSIDMRLQRAEYSMLPPPEPEFDPISGNIVNKLSFTAVSMNERSGAASSNEELEEAGATLRMVLFPLVVKNTVAEEGNAEHEEEEEQQIVVCPAQVHVTPLKKSGRGAGKTVRVMSAQGGRSEASYSVGDDDGDTRMEGGMF